MQLLVKDFAAECGVSESIIYRHIRNHRDALGEGVIKKARQTWLTDEAQVYIRKLMVQQPISVVASDARAEKLEARVHELEELLSDKEKVLALAQQQVQAAQTRVDELQLQAGRTLALTEARDEYKALAAAQAETAAQRAAEAAKAQEEAALLRTELEAAKERERLLKGRNLWERLMRKGE